MRLEISNTETNLEVTNKRSFYCLRKCHFKRRSCVFFVQVNRNVVTFGSSVIAKEQKIYFLAVQGHIY